MKKLLLPICAVLMCMVSCQKEGNDILTLVMEEYGSDAKLHLDNDNYTVWDNGDYIWLNGSQKQVLVDETTATINTNMDNRAFTAIYPYDWARGGSGELWAPEGAEELDMTGVEYPSTQRYEELSSGIQKVVAPMAGTCSAQESTLKFHNLGCILAVEVTNNTGATMNVKKIEVIADGAGTYLCGKYNILFGLYSIFHVSGGNNKVTLDCGFEGVSVANNSSKKFYIALPPVTAKLTVKVYDDYYYYTQGQASTHTLARSCGYNAGITITNSTARTQYAPFNNQIMYTTNNGEAIDFTDYAMHTPSNQTKNVDNIWFATFANNLTSIPADAFSSMRYKDTKFVSVTLPLSVTTVGDYSFWYNSSLEFISMPGVVTIDNNRGYVLSNCICLETVILGPNISAIGKNTFSDCGSIRNFYCYSATPPTLDENTFAYCLRGAATLHVPAGCKRAYQTAQWREFGTIVDDL